MAELNRAEGTEPGIVAKSENNHVPINGPTSDGAAICS